MESICKYNKKKEYTKLDLTQLDYSLPMVGAIKKQGKLFANSASMS